MKWCMSTDVGTWTNWLNFEPDTDYSPDAGTGLLSVLSYERWCSDFTSGNSNVYVLAAAAMCGFTMVLFTEPVSRRNIFVRGTCAPPSALLVFLCENCRQVISHQHGKAVFWFCEYLVTCVLSIITRCICWLLLFIVFLFWRAETESTRRGELHVQQCVTTL